MTDQNNLSFLKNYNKHYYLKRCEGAYEFFKGEISRRLKTVFGYAKLKPGEKVLDIGCGRGDASMECVRRGCVVWGVDYSQDAIDIALEYSRKLLGKKQKNASFCRMNATKLKFPDGYFDVVLLNDLVEHLYPDELKKTISEVKRVTKNGGRIVIRTPDVWFSKMVSVIFAPFGYKESSEHINLLSIADLKKLLTDLSVKVYLYKEKGSFYKDIKLADYPRFIKSIARFMDIIFDNKVFAGVVKKSFLAELLLENICIVATKYEK